jgi:hypothetical protein
VGGYWDHFRIGERRLGRLHEREESANGPLWL